MSTTIDERVVEMRFDNAQFEKNVATSMSTIDKLKAKLNFSNSAKGLENINNVSRSITFDTMSNSIEVVKNKFSALQVMGVTALANITNSAVNAGKQLVNSLAIDAKKMGFQEYETQMNAVQTILANTSSKGTTLDQVNAALDELNTYADKTIYNFTEMTKNIGTFTAAGIDLDTATKSIKGIANLAAVSGSTSQQASTAMYQLSQALASGTVKLMDWNSVVNAGMGGQVFQDALKETAEVMNNVDMEAMIAEYGSFRETLSTGWITAEVLNETLEKFTTTTEGLTDAQIEQNRELWRSRGYSEAQIDAIFKLGETATNAATKVKTFTQLMDTMKESAQSGWAQTWKIVIGDFEEAKALFTEVSDVIGGMINKMAETRNAKWLEWDALGGRDVAIEALRNAFEGLLSVVTPVKEAFREIFPPSTGQKFYDLTVKIRDITAGLKLSTEESDNLKRTFRGLFSIGKVVAHVFSSIFNAISNVFGKGSDTNSGLLDITASMGDWLYNLSETITKTNTLQEGLEAVLTTIKEIGSAIGSVLGLDDIFKTGEDARKIDKGTAMASAVPMVGMTATLTEVSSDLKTVGKTAEESEDKVSSSFGALSKAFTKTGEVFTANPVLKVIANFFSGIGDTISTGSKIVALFGVVILGGVLVLLFKFARSIIKIIDGLGDVMHALPKLVDTITNTFKKLGDVFDEVKSYLKAQKLKAYGELLLSFAAAIAIITASVVVLTLLDPEKLKTATVVMISLMAALTAMVVVIAKTADPSELFKSVAAMAALTVAIASLSGVMIALGNLDAGKITNGLFAVGGLAAILAGVAVAVSKYGTQMTTGMGGMVLFALSINLLAKALLKISNLDFGSMVTGLIGVVGLIAALGAFITYSKFDKSILKASIGLLIFTKAIDELVDVVIKLATVETSFWKLVGGFAGVIVMIGVMGSMMESQSFQSNVLSASAGLLLVSFGISILTDAVIELSEINFTDILKGIVGLVGTVFSLGVAIAALSLMVKQFGNANILQIGIGILALSAGLSLIMYTLKDISSVPIEEIGWSFLMLVGLFATISAVTAAMPDDILQKAAGLLGVAAAMAVLGIALNMVANMSSEGVEKSIFVFGIALGVLAVALTAMQGTQAGALALISAAAGIAVLAIAFALLSNVDIQGLAAGILAALGGIAAVALVSSIASQPLLILAAAMAIVGVAVLALGGGVLLLADAFKKFSDTTDEECDRFSKTFKKMLISMLEALPPAIEKLGEALITGIEVFFEALDYLLYIIDYYTPSFMESGSNIILSILEGIANHMSGLVQKGIDIALAFIDGITQKLGDIIDAGVKLIVSFIQGMADAIEENSDELVDALYNLAVAMANTLMDVISSGNELFKEIGGYIIEGIIEGITGMWSALTDKVAEIGTTVYETLCDVLGIASPAKAGIEVGKFVDQGLIVGLDKYAKNVSDAAGNVGDNAVASMTNAISGVSNAINSDIDYEPTIRPVLDLTDIQNGANSLNTMLGRRHVASIAGSYRTTQQVDPQESMDAMINKLGAKYAEQMAAVISNSSTPVNVNVALQGDSAKIFKVVRNENNKYIRTTGANPLNP